MIANIDLIILALPLLGALVMGFLGETARKWLAVIVSALTAGLVFYMMPEVWNEGALGGAPRGSSASG